MNRGNVTVDQSETRGGGWEEGGWVLVRLRSEKDRSIMVS